MTHEIHFVARAGEAVNKDRAIGALLATGHWHAASDSDGLRYANPDTGVLASLEPIMPADLPDGYRALGIALVLNYVRPTWFALEAVRSLAEAANAGALLVLDPQAGDTPAVAEPNTLVASWERGNHAAVAAARRAGADLPSMDRDRSLAFWRHQFSLARLKLGFSADHYVPSLRLVRRAGSLRVERAMSWPDFVPTLLPECDIVILLRSDPTAGFVITGVADADTVRQRLTHVTEYMDLDLHESTAVAHLSPRRSAEATALLEGIPTEAFDTFEAVGPDGFVDDAVEGEEI